MKRLLSFLLAVVTVLALTPAVMATASETETVTEISNATELLAISGKAGHYVLTEDISFDGATYTEPQIVLSIATLDGNGHTVSGFKLQANGKDLSLFAMDTAENNSVTVKNLNVGSASASIAVEHDGTGFSVGVLFAKIPLNTSCHLEKVSVYSNFAKSSGEDNNKYVGGLIGFVDSGDVTLVDCVSGGTVQSQSICGTGGFIGLANGTVDLEGCVNNATVNAKNAVGGFVGWLSFRLLNANNCMNYGTVTADQERAGGLIGYVQSGSTGSANDVRISGCSNHGNINGKKELGGLIGKIDSANKTVAGVFKLDACKQYGVINATEQRAGGLVGYATMNSDDLTVTSCANYGEVKAQANGGCAGGVVSEVYTTGTFTVNGFLNMGNLTSGTSASAGSRAATVVALSETKNDATRTTLIDIDNVLNLGVITGRWQPGSMVGYTDAVKLTIDNCINVGHTKRWNGSAADSMATYDQDTTTTSFTTAASGSNNYYVEAPSGAAYSNTLGATKTAFANVLDVINRNDTLVKAFGKFKWSDANKSAIVQATPALKGVQFGKMSEGVYSARLVATIQNTEYYENIGFEITVSDKTSKIHYSANVYETIYGNDNGLVTYTAQKLGGKYVYGLVINNIPIDQEVTLAVKTYAKDADGEYYGDAQTLIFKDGVLIYRSGMGGVGWSLDFPRYEGGTLMKGYYGVNYGYESISAPNIKNYKQLCAYGTNEAEFNAYVQTLTEEGYTLTEVNNDAFIKSYWVEKDGMRMYMYLSVNAGEARFILDQNEAVSMEEFSYTYAKQTGDNTALYLYGLHMDKLEGKNVGEKYSNGTVNTTASNCGQMFIIKLADNSVVIIDGGADNQMSKEAAEGLDAFLHEITGTSQNEQVRIACWLITHSHIDHFGGFARFLINYHESYDLERICFNFNYIDSNMPTLFGDEYLGKYYPDLMYYRPHTGETIQLADVTLDILYTCEDNVDAETGELIKEHFTWNNTYGIDQNNSSMVARITFDGKSFMLLGDIYGAAEDVIMQNYSEESLKADIMQVAHHGFNNLPELVAAINPSVSLYPQSEVGAVKANSGTANTVLQNVIQNTEGGKDNLYFAGECTARVEVVDGALQVTISDVISADYDNAWTIFTPFEESDS